jgi:hypothetical protein
VREEGRREKNGFLLQYCYIVATVHVEEEPEPVGAVSKRALEPRH